MLLVFMVLSLALISGCENNEESKSIGQGEKNVPRSTVTDTTTLEPTKYETVNNFDGVTMTIKEGTVSSSGLTVKFNNNSQNQCIYGEHYSLEQKIDSHWYQVPVVIKGEYGFNDIGYELTPGNERELAVDWKWLYGSLEKGEYRIVKDVVDFMGTGKNNPTYNLAAEFVIPNHSIN